MECDNEAASLGLLLLAGQAKREPRRPTAYQRASSEEPGPSPTRKERKPRANLQRVQQQNKMAQARYRERQKQKMIELTARCEELEQLLKQQNESQDADGTLVLVMRQNAQLEAALVAKDREIDDLRRQVAFLESGGRRASPGAPMQAINSVTGQASLPSPGPHQVPHLDQDLLAVAVKSMGHPAMLPNIPEVKVPVMRADPPLDPYSLSVPIMQAPWPQPAANTAEAANMEVLQLVEQLRQALTASDLHKGPQPALAPEATEALRGTVTEVYLAIAKALRRQHLGAQDLMEGALLLQGKAPWDKAREEWGRVVRALQLSEIQAGQLVTLHSDYMPKMHRLSIKRQGVVAKLLPCWLRESIVPSTNSMTSTQTGPNGSMTDYILFHGAPIEACRPAEVSMHIAELQDVAFEEQALLLDITQSSLLEILQPLQAARFLCHMYNPAFAQLVGLGRPPKCMCVALTQAVKLMMPEQ